MQHYFLVVFGHDGQKPLELRTEEELDCNEWVECIQQARSEKTPQTAAVQSAAEVSKPWVWNRWRKLHMK